MEVKYEPRGNVIQHVVEFRGESSDVQVFLAGVAYHGVHRVRRLVEEAQRRASKPHEEHWRGYSIGGVFRDGLDCGADNSVSVEGLSVPSDYH